MKWPLSTSLPRHYRSLLRSCAQQSSLQIGKQLHAIILTTGLAVFPNAYLLNALSHMYAACGDMPRALYLFDETPPSHKDIVDWTTLMSSYNRRGTPLETRNLFSKLHEEGVKPDEVTMVCFFNACAQLLDIASGTQGHVCIVKYGLEFSVSARNAIMDVYAKCGRMDSARKVFEDMRERSVVSWTVLLDGVVKWEGSERGRLIFDEMIERNEIGWTVMIAGYVGEGFTKESFFLLEKMIFNERFGMNFVSVCSILSASSQSGDLTMGRWIHAYWLKTTDDLNIMVSTSLVDMYAKCGRIDFAVKMFENMPQRNVVAWNAILSGLATHGRGREVLNFFFRMVEEEVKPDEVTFTAVLSACSHSGLVVEGRRHFHNLESFFNIKPRIEHYACMVDLLGRAGYLEEAADLVQKMPIRPNEVVLGSLLGACCLQRNLRLGQKLLEELTRIHPLNTEHHVLLSNMYSLAGKEEKANSLRRVLKNRGVRKVPGMSSIQISGGIHRFSAGDSSHPRSREIYAVLEEMIRRLRLAGYVPDTRSQVFPGGEIGEEEGGAEQEEREQALFAHSEKLAICFGLLSTRDGTPLYIFKNLRVCGDCHSAIKVASRVYDREIIVRDRNRFHCFKNGSCSCSDYW